MVSHIHARVWRLAARCPSCGAPVRIRNTDAAIRMLALAKKSNQIGPETVIQTYQCARVLKDGTLCNELVEIKLRHWKELP